MGSKEELRRIEADLKYWQELADILDWEILGWTYKNSVTYIVAGETLLMSGKQRDAIMKTMEAIHDGYYEMQGEDA